MKEIIIVNGTCGSGKITIGKQIRELYGYHHIESDEIIKSIKEKTGIRPEYRLPSMNFRGLPAPPPCEPEVAQVCPLCKTGG